MLGMLYFFVYRLDRCALTDIGYLGGVGLFDFNGHAYEDDMCRSENHRDQINIQLQGNMSDCAFKVTVMSENEFELKMFEIVNSLELGYVLIEICPAV